VSVAVSVLSTVASSAGVSVSVAPLEPGASVSVRPLAESVPPPSTETV
jgi:hypothetical protein